MDKTTKILLFIIAAALCAIAFKLPQHSSSPTLGDFIALRDIEDPNSRKAIQSDLMKNLPVVWIKGGEVDATLTGAVRIE